MAKDKKASSGGASGSQGRQGNKGATEGSGTGLSQEEKDSRSYETINDYAAGIEVLSEMYSRQNFNAEQEAALAEYKGQGFAGMNAYLRDPENFDDWVNANFITNSPAEFQARKQHIIDMANTLKNAPAPAIGRDVTLYRHMNLVSAPQPLREVFKEFMEYGEQFSPVIGARFQDKGFTSTSINPDNHDGYGLIVRMRAPKETRGWTPDPKSWYAAESEFVLRPGSTFVIRGHERQGKDLVIDVDIE